MEKQVYYIGSNSFNDFLANLFNDAKAALSKYIESFNIPQPETTDPTVLNAWSKNNREQSVEYQQRIIQSMQQQQAIQNGLIAASVGVLAYYVFFR